jgi:hypothetical protein
MLASPVPLIIGLNCPENILMDEYIPEICNEDHNDIIFVLLDSKNIYQKGDEQGKITPIFYDDFIKLERNFGHLFSPRKTRNYKVETQKINKEKVWVFKQVKFLYYGRNGKVDLTPHETINTKKIRLSKKSGPKYNQTYKP